MTTITSMITPENSENNKKAFKGSQTSWELV